MRPSTTVRGGQAPMIRPRAPKGGVGARTRVVRIANRVAGLRRDGGRNREKEMDTVSQRTAMLVGAGRMGQAHAQALRELGITLSAVCDRRAEARDGLGEAFGVPAARRFADATAMFETAGAPDLVVIATTADTHCALTCDAARAGASAILCEKPMAGSLEECDAMIQACHRADARLAINHQMRFMDQYRVVKEELASGRLGRLGSMNVVGGAFGLAMNGSHYIEAFHFLTGSRPARAAAYFTGDPIPNPRGPDFFDQGGDFRFVADSGQRLSLSIGHDQGHGMTAIYAAERGHMFVDEMQGEAVVTTRKPEHRDAPTTRYGMPWDRRSLTFPRADNVAPTRAVAEALLAGNDFPDGEAGRAVVAAIAACYLSAERGGMPVALNETATAADRRFPWA